MYTIKAMDRMPNYYNRRNDRQGLKLCLQKASKALNHLDNKLSALLITSGIFQITISLCFLFCFVPLFPKLYLQFQAALLQRWDLPDFMCAFCPFVQTVSVNVSVFTLTAIAVDRHRAIINPLR